MTDLTVVPTPLLAHWAAGASWIPDSAAFIVSGSLPHSTGSATTSRETPAATPADPVTSTSALPLIEPQAAPRATGVSHFPAPVVSQTSMDAPAPAAGSASNFSLGAVSALLLLYLAGCGVFIQRNAYGVWAYV